MKVALVSLDQKWEDKAHNLARCETLTGRAAALGAELVIFPEMTLTGFTMNTALSAEPTEASPSVKAFGEMAARHGVWLIAGVVFAGGERATNALLCWSPEGREAARYLKIHPFSYAGEHEHFTGGESLEVVRLPEWSVGATICYDLRFPELYTALSTECDVLVNIANWPARRLAHWNTLLRARAIENQAIVIGVNRTGTDGNGLQYERSSMIVDANGESLAPLVTKGEIDVVELDRDRFLAFRATFPTRQDRRPAVYQRSVKTARHPQLG